MVRRTLVAFVIGAFCIAAPVQADEQLLYLTSDAGGQRLLDAELNRDYFSLASYLESEQILTFCGPATVAGVANSLDIPRPSPTRLFPWALFTQDTLFNPANQALKPYAMVEHEGLTLDELDSFIENVGLAAEHRFADETSVDELRAAIKQTLGDSNARLIVNYSRKALPQNGDGHISPVAAYDEDTDTVLILDVAKYKYPPVWISVEKLHEAMMLVDAGSNRSRGFVQVSVK
ncbi:phytochelatin synthase family protein [Hoeflea ulvae]|uniref:glutathione gamma-glutamylcysteinyltransferase n=1 Tax=Hoeflea ulvae TaxID=2983764 RepID=A0ABT3YLT2_9HYPH|nr:phytochelatin synthase family protein [Hoeflea ulvae]MCY0096864.1 phytochelatin synthase family protein [Hoeflea ulvae]